MKTDSKSAQMHINAEQIFYTMAINMQLVQLAQAQ
jgi:hypothetical protein